MSYFDILIIAVALSMDVFIIGFGTGARTSRIDKAYVLRMALCFGLSQGIMLVAGWSGGFHTRHFLANYANILAFLLFSYLGIQMVLEGFCKKTIQHKTIAGTSLILLSIVTSVDALAVGFSISVYNYSILFPIILISTMTFLLTILGVMLGCYAAHFRHMERYTEISGGLMLLIIGLKNLYSGI